MHLIDRKSTHRRSFTSILLALAVLLGFAVFVPGAEARHDDRYDRGRSEVPERVARLAHELENASRHAYDLNQRHHRGYDRAMADAFAGMEDAAIDYHRTVEARRSDAYAVERAFQRVVDRYYRLRGEFRYFHGSADVRTAFHRINGPMERLYRIHTGRDLYRDDPTVSRSGRRGPLHPSGHRDRERWDDRERGRGHGDDHRDGDRAVGTRPGRH